MTDVLVILDGATEPLDGDEPTCLDRARTPVLDALAQLGTLRRLATTPAGLPAGSETGCALLLGWHPPAPVDRAALEAAARDIEIPGGAIACRVDVFGAGGARADAGVVRAVAEGASAAGAGASAVEDRADTAAVAVHQIGGHRLLLVGAAAAVDLAAEAAARLAPAVHRWPSGASVPRRLDERTVVVAAPGAVLGLARLLGAATHTPEGYEGGARALLTPLAEAVRALLTDGEVDRIVVHVDGPDEAAHERSGRRKVEAIEAADEELLLPVTAALHEVGGVLEVAIDHGCDPRDGTHDGAPTPFLRWNASGEDDPADEPEDAADGVPSDPDRDPDAPGASTGLDPEDLPLMALPKRRAHATAQTGRRLTERWVLPLPVEVPPMVATGSAGAGDDLGSSR